MENRKQHPQQNKAAASTFTLDKDRNNYIRYIVRTYNLYLYDMYENVKNHPNKYILVYFKQDLAKVNNEPIEYAMSYRRVESALATIIITTFDYRYIRCGGMKSNPTDHTNLLETTTSNEIKYLS